MTDILSMLKAAGERRTNQGRVHVKYDINQDGLVIIASCNPYEKRALVRWKELEAAKFDILYEIEKFTIEAIYRYTNASPSGEAF